jgi:hypothetical protein
MPIRTNHAAASSSFPAFHLHSTAVKQVARKLVIQPEMLCEPPSHCKAAGRLEAGTPEAAGIGRLAIGQCDGSRRSVAPECLPKQFVVATCGSVTSNRLSKPKMNNTNLSYCRFLLRNIFVTILDSAKSLLSSESLTAKVAILLNAVTIVAVAILTWHSQVTANNLQRGENTITLLNGYTGGDVQKAQSAIREFVIGQMNDATKLSLDQTTQSQRFVREFFPYIRHTEVVATCVEKELCLSDVVMSHSCLSIVTIFGSLDKYLPDLEPAPSKTRGNTRKLVDSCRDFVKKNPDLL